MRVRRARVWTRIARHTLLDHSPAKNPGETQNRRPRGGASPPGPSKLCTPPPAVWRHNETRGTMARAPTTSAKKKARAKKKAPARRCGWEELIAFIVAIGIAAEARDGPDCLLTREEKFAAFQADMCDIVNKVGDYLGVKLSFTPVNLPVGATWDANGLCGVWMLVLGHFETAAIGLFGVLRAVGFGGVLKSSVWRLLNTSLGTAAFSSMVLWNIVPFAAHHDAGKDIWSGWPEEAKALLLRLQLASLNTLGAPAKVAGFGDEVRNRSG